MKKLESPRAYDHYRPRRLIDVEDEHTPQERERAKLDAAYEAARRQEEKVRSLAEAAAIQRAAKKAKAGARGSDSRRPPRTKAGEEAGSAAEGGPAEGQSSGKAVKRKRPAV